ncbi:NACHT, LRR and PYD domains-containing protein 3-like isoform X2 [Alosa pseudoharengus]|uniref:NACHT, LRR and PYD domains-containing protein 3-like isoform X2 n=1 Tax=Alosa pseudoharengus TaxID=34774 RepID=UPI003F89A00B
MAESVTIPEDASPYPISSDQTSSHHKAPMSDQTIHSKERDADAGSAVDVERSKSPSLSYCSMESDDSLKRIIKFEPGSTSPIPSGLDLKSEDSMDIIGRHFRREEPREGIDANNTTIPRIIVNGPDECLDYPSNNIGNGPGLLTAATGGQLERSGSPETCYSSMRSTSMESVQETHDTDIESDNLKQDLDPSETQGGNDKAIKEARQHLKQRYKDQFEYAFEVSENPGAPTLLNEIYTELYITTGGSGKFNTEHEVWQLERVSRLKTSGDVAIKYNDIFKPSSTQQMNLKTVLTKGIAGIGKTFSVRKFILDWAEGNGNQDIDFVLLLPFRDLNLKKGKEHSLVELIHQYFPELTDVMIDEVKVICIFDGLDECRLSLDFLNHPSLADINQPASVDILLTNIIKGDLLSHSSLWITSRPAATNQLPPEYVQRVTEIRGFNDAQKEEYFRRRIQDQAQAERVIKHIKSSRSLHIMCYMPVFCCMSASVLQTMSCEPEGDESPKTLTQMFTHFLLIELKLKREKDQAKNLTQTESDQDILVKLGKLAFKNLKEGQLVFYEGELTDCGIDFEAHNGLFAQMFKRESGIFEEKVYCFVHLSIQEYLAALYAVIMCTRGEVVVTPDKSLSCTSPVSISPTENRPNTSLDKSLSLCKAAVGKALQKENGQLDLFLRFLLGLSLESAQKILGSHLSWTGISPDTVKQIIQFIRKKIRVSPSPERTINLFHCLHEMNDDSFVEEVQEVMSSGKMISETLEPDQCSALAYVLLMSEKVQDIFDLKTYNTTEMGIQRLIPVVKSCKSAILHACNLSQLSCEIIVSALQTVNSHLVELDLSYNDLQGLTKLFSSGIKSENCKLEKLILRACNLTKDTCSDIFLAIQCPHSHLRAIDLGGNVLQDEGVQQLCTALLSQHCNIEELRLSDCSLTGSSCTYLSSVLESPHSKLRQLILDNNDLQNTGVEIFSCALKKPSSNLEKLGLSGCRVTEEGCSSLVNALKTNTTTLQHLDLSYNHLGDTETLSALQKDSNNNLRTVCFEFCGKRRDKPGMRKYAVCLSFDPEATDHSISLSDGDTKAIQGPHSQKKYGTARCRAGLTDRCYWETELTGEAQSEISVGLTTKGEGGTEKCWSLKSSAIGGSFYAQYFSIMDPLKRRPIEIESLQFKRLGVFLDWSAGTVSFYTADPVDGPRSLLYTFHATFTEPLYPFFKIQGSQSSVSLCEME